MRRFHYFPQPYPDELLGSVLLRACRHLSISQKVLSARMLGIRRSYWSLVMPGELGQIALATGLDAEQLLWHHTAFPYATAFASREATDRLAETSLSSATGGNAALTQAVTRGNFGQRYCLHCVAEDYLRFGETYWRRTHNLPFVVSCPIHRKPLKAHPWTRGTNALGALPDELDGTTVRTWFTPEWELTITRLSSDVLLRTQRIDPSSWHLDYSRQAEAIGLNRVGRGFDSSGFAQAFRTHYGTRFLNAVGLDFEVSGNAWPALMLRKTMIIPFTTPKHILLQAFLLLAETPNAEVPRRRPGRQPRDYAALDQTYAKTIQRALKKVMQRGERIEVTRLLIDLNLWHVVRHHRHELPLTAALLHAFRKTDFSARQLGKRVRKRP